MTGPITVAATAADPTVGDEDLGLAAATAIRATSSD
jgi:hypothetical protein